ncbi:hypothetical protein AOC06_02020 [Polynucleobacter paludilacus]|uniref:hypothetical protein n=1 Tax=Polynucleobacter paludilacus TaxID=1855895 RepID=UPI001BFD694A|nr:hypothetical protein [Polynucleobacter paludilacus]QWD87379.1 hypothetical protein AOC06_02020 [Polynucleobacter paludilacus]
MIKKTDTSNVVDLEAVKSTIQSASAPATKSTPATKKAPQPPVVETEAEEAYQPKSVFQERNWNKGLK